MRRPKDSKSNICTEGVDVYVAGISVEVGVHYPGRPVVSSVKRLPTSRGVGKKQQESAEGIVVMFNPGLARALKRRHWTHWHDEGPNEITPTGCQLVDSEGEVDKKPGMAEPKEREYWTESMKVTLRHFKHWINEAKQSCSLCYGIG